MWLLRAAITFQKGTKSSQCLFGNTNDQKNDSIKIRKIFDWFQLCSPLPIWELESQQHDMNLCWQSSKLSDNMSTSSFDTIQLHSQSKSFYISPAVRYLYFGRHRVTISKKMKVLWSKSVYFLHHFWMFW